MKANCPWCNFLYTVGDGSFCDLVGKAIKLGVSSEMANNMSMSQMREVIAGKVIPLGVGGSDLFS